MSNKTQLQTNNTVLDEYIARINAAKEVAASLPEAGGGGSVGTCNVTINGCGGYYAYSATVYENGSITFKNEILSDRSSASVVLQNVLCGSIIHFVNGISMVEPAFTITNGIEVIGNRYIYNYNRDYYLKAPIESGVSASITFIDND